MRRVEYDYRWGWIARRRDGSEVIPDFRWASRSVARTVCRESDFIDDRAKREGHPA